MDGSTAQGVEQERTDTARGRRRRLARDVRSVRERLTSTTGLDRAHDHELVRLFAEYRLNAAVPLVVFILAIAVGSTIWLPAPVTALWVSLVLSSTAVTLHLARRFIAADPETVSLPKWRRLFVAGDLLSGMTWALVVRTTASIEGLGASEFLLFLLVMLAAITAMLAATIPAAVYAGLAPLTLAVVVTALLSPNVETVLLAIMVVSAHLLFVFLASRLRASTFAAMRFRAEKDAIVVELEEAKANSDQARLRAEEANLAKSRFLATMSHELRTPLNAILGFSEVMKNEVFGAHAAPAYRDYASDIHASGQHLLNLINEILDLSRIEAGRYEVNEEAISLAHVAEECRHMLHMRARAKNQIVREVFAAGLPRLWADERSLRQIVLNLLSNAIKFTPPGGEITVKVGWTSSGGQYVSVVDTGPGIPEDEIPTILSSFGRGSLALKTAEQGSGLGLPIVKGLADLHGGSLLLRSKPREGTEVTVTFPATRVMESLPAVAVEEPRRGGAKAA